MDEYLIDALYEKRNERQNICRSFRAITYTKVKESTSKVFGMPFNKNKLKHCLKTIKKNFAAVEDFTNILVRLVEMTRRGDGC